MDFLYDVSLMREFANLSLTISVRLQFFSNFIDKFNENSVKINLNFSLLIVTFINKLKE